MATILIVDDDPGLKKLVASTLKDAGHRALLAEGADEALALLKKETPDILLLDVELPGLSGFKLLELLKEDLKTAAIAVIMLTVRGDENSKVRGLRTGADDYLVKPFSSKELLARVEALLRRTRQAGQMSRILESGNIRMDLDRQDVLVNNRRIDLRPTEFNLLTVFLQHKGYVLSYETLSSALSQGTKDMTSDNLYQHVTHLRSKLGPEGRRIETVHGTGYKFLEN